jgi:hypothetical protein
LILLEHHTTIVYRQKLASTSRRYYNLGIERFLIRLEHRTTIVYRQKLASTSSLSAFRLAITNPYSRPSLFPRFDYALVHSFQRMYYSSSYCTSRTDRHKQGGGKNEKKGAFVSETSPHLLILYSSVRIGTDSLSFVIEALKLLSLCNPARSIPVTACLSVV